MTVVSTLSNHFKHEAMAGDIDFPSHVFKMILMNITFAFDKDAHATLADVTGDQLATANGYTQDTKVMPSGELTEDDANDRGNMTWGDVTWTASSGDIGPTGAAVIYDETEADDTVVGCIDFGADYTISDGASLTIKDSIVRLT